MVEIITLFLALLVNHPALEPGGGIAAPQQAVQWPAATAEALTALDAVVYESLNELDLSPQDKKELLDALHEARQEIQKDAKKRIATESKRP